MLRAISEKLKISQVKNGPHTRVQGQINSADMDLLSDMLRHLAVRQIRARLYLQGSGRASCRVMVTGTAMTALAQLILDEGVAGDRAVEYAGIVECFPLKPPAGRRRRKAVSTLQE